MATCRTFSRSRIDASDAIHDFSCSPCSKDGKNTEALYHCMICHMFYCERCVDVHNKFTANHSVTYKTSDKFGHESGKLPTDSSNELPTDLCEEHHGEVLKMYCGQHDVVCCTVCIAVNHRSCNGVEYIPNIASGFLKRHDKGKMKHSLEEMKAGLENRKSKIQKDLQILNAQRDKFIADIQSFKKRIIARVEEMERKSFEEVNSKHKELTDELNAYNKKIDDLVKIVGARLDKLSHSRNDNEAQMFVGVKKGEKELSAGHGLVKQISSEDTKAMLFEINTQIEVFLSKERSLGSVKEYLRNVDIVCPFDTKITAAYLTELQGQLKSYNIESKHIKYKEIAGDRYTIVVFENGINIEDEAVEKISGTRDDMIILMNILPCGHLPYSAFHDRMFKASYLIEFDEMFLSFDKSSNQAVYKAVSDILKGSI